VAAHLLLWGGGERGFLGAMVVRKRVVEALELALSLRH